MFTEKLNRKYRFLICLVCVTALICSCASPKTGGKDAGNATGSAQEETGKIDGQNVSEGNTGTDGSVGSEISEADTEGSVNKPDQDKAGQNTAEQDAEMVDPNIKSVTIDLNTEYQTFDGFGAAYTWYGERLLNSKDPEGGLDALFTDAKLTVLRFKNEYGYHMEGKASNADAMAQNYKEARDRAAAYGERVYVLMCCWSPPASLKSDNTIRTGYGTIKKNDDGSYAYDEYARWWVDSLKYYMARGIVIDYVSIQNEVDFAPDDYEGCLFGPKETDSQASYAKAFLAVYRAIHEEFGDDAPLMLGPETMSCEPGTLLKYTGDILKEIPEALAGVAYHLYVGGNSDGDSNTVRPSSYMTNFSGISNYFSDVKRWETEFYIGHGIQTAELIHYALTYANMTAYLYWSGVWADSQPNKFETYDLIEVNNAGKWRRTANYYALRHYSQFIRPGYVRIDAVSGEGAVKCTAFTSPYKNKIAAVLVNTSDEEKKLRLDIPGYTVTGSEQYVSVFGDECTSENGLFESKGSFGQSQVVTIPAKAVLSVDIEGYAGNTPPVIPEVTPIVYEDDVITKEPESEVPGEDVVLIDTSFSSDDGYSFTGMGGAMARIVADGGSDSDGGLEVSGRTDTWNGIALPNDLFEHYGYYLKVSYDCMTEKGGTISCTPTFNCNGGTHYPSGENDRVVCENMEGGKWYHAEGIMTMYSNMDKSSYMIYWEYPDNTDNFYLDNIKVEILYTKPAGEYTE
ncbi:MAG: hypothetical protein K6G81_08865 [Lachnospiraceae bacterium]|nr:hypothetical protein [Lachnospiraceae bacterium]